VTNSGAYLQYDTKALNAPVGLARVQGRPRVVCPSDQRDGVTENLGDFASDSEAKDWIARKSIAYFKARQK
jgi:hypothetical protein